MKRLENPLRSWGTGILWRVYAYPESIPGGVSKDLQEEAKRELSRRGELSKREPEEGDLPLPLPF